MAEVAEETRRTINPSREIILRLKRATTRLASFELAVEMSNFLRKVIATEKFETVEELLSILTAAGKKITTLEPHEYVVRNVLFMVCKSVREEHTRLVNGGADPLPPYESLNRLWTSEEATKKREPATGKGLRKSVIAGVKDLVSELELSREGIALQAEEHLGLSDVLLVHSLAESNSLLTFISASKRNVISVDSAVDESHEQISLADVAASMRRVSKVLLPSAAVFPDGSCLVPAGGLSIAIAARRHSVPVIVLASIYKLTPRYPPEAPILMGAPNLPFTLSSSLSPCVNVIRPKLDLLPAKLVSLFISSSFALSPIHIYRLMGDYFHPDDIANTQI